MNKLHTLLHSVIRFWTRWNELQLATILILCWPLFVAGMRSLDPTSAPLDPGVMHVLYIACIFFALLHALVWVTIKFNMPVVWRYFEDKFAEDFKQLSQWEKIISSLLLLVSLLLFAVLTLLAVAGIAG